MEKNPSRHESLLNNNTAELGARSRGPKSYSVHNPILYDLASENKLRPAREAANEIEIYFTLISEPKAHDPGLAEQLCHLQRVASVFGYKQLSDCADFSVNRKGKGGRRWSTPSHFEGLIPVVIWKTLLKDQGQELHPRATPGSEGGRGM